MAQDCSEEGEHLDAGSADPVLKVIHSLSEIPAAEWNACANPNPATYNPFVSHAFLKALEDAGTVTARTGWLPQYTVLERAGETLGCMAGYLKSHSQGEYMFDYAWAHAYEQAGGDYYPKLQVAVPFTPVPGPRLLVKPHPAADAHRQYLAAGAVDLAKRQNLSSLHITFLAEAEWTELGDIGFLQRVDQQFHWQNEGYETFDDFLAALASRKRKAVRKEREKALSAGLEIEWVQGADITEAHWDAFFQFYIDTGSRKWGNPYLNRRFFSLLGEAMADDCLLMFANRDGHPIAGALNMIGGECLYGRYWGCTEHHDCLHFELCYYQAIDYAIAHGLKRVEAGAQGEHKLARGYVPSPTYSVHWVADPGFRRAIANYLERERDDAEYARAMLSEYTPFKKG